jgi:hypothetical protein
VITGRLPIYVDPGATASDNVDGDISGNITSTTTVNINTAGSYTVVYYVNDAAGNEATPVIRNVEVVKDVSPDDKSSGGSASLTPETYCLLLFSLLIGRKRGQSSRNQITV